MKKALFLAALLPLALNAQMICRPAQGEIPSDAQLYQLPQTVLHLEIEVVHIAETPGEYARYSEKYLGISQVIAEEKEWNELSCVKLSTRVRPDDSRRFYLQAQGEMPSVGTNADGILCGLGKANASGREAQAVRTGAQASRPGTRAASKGAGPVGRGAASRQREEFHKEGSLPHSSAEALYTQEMHLANASTRVAELAAKQIFTLRETRLALLQGELETFPQDGESLKLFLKELDKTERAYTELFTGHRDVRRETVCLDLVPSAENGEQVAFRFSSVKGVLDADDLSGSPVYLTIETADDGLSQLPDSTTRLVQHGKKVQEVKEAIEPSVCYYLPRRSSVCLSFDDRSLFEADMVLAQCGKLRYLYDKGQAFQAAFDPQTGALLRLEWVGDEDENPHK